MKNIILSSLLSRKYLLSFCNFIAVTLIIAAMERWFYLAGETEKMLILIGTYIAFLGLNSGLYNWYNIKAKAEWIKNNKTE